MGIFSLEGILGVEKMVGKNHMRNSGNMTAL